MLTLADSSDRSPQRREIYNPVTESALKVRPFHLRTRESPYSRTMLIATNRTAHPHAGVRQQSQPRPTPTVASEPLTSTRQRLGQLTGTAITVGHTAAALKEAFPGFISPSIHGATPLEQQQITQILDGLPLHHVSQIDTVSMVPEIASGKPGWVTLGTAWDYPASSEIRLSQKELTSYDKMADTLIHEVGHTTDYSRRPFRLGPTASSHTPYGEGAKVTEYAGTNAREDYAESYQEYHQRPENLREVNPAKYEDQKQSNTPGFFDRLVDREEFRETGKTIGRWMGPNKITRHTLESVGAAAGLHQVGHGLTQWVDSASTGDGLQHASGILNTVSGALAFTGAAPLAAVSLQAANQALGRAVKRGELSGDEVGATVATAVRPIEAAFGRKASPIEADHRPGKVLAVAAGGALGGTVGALAGPYLGVLAGYHIAGGVGGAIGLVAGGALGFLGGSELGGRLGSTLADLRHPT